MARVVPGYRYLSIAGLLTPDVERMSSPMLKQLLERRLRAVESRLRTLSDQLEAVEGRTGVISDWKWSKAPMSNERWAFLADLSYYIPARDALQDALSAL